MKQKIILGIIWTAPIFAASLLMLVTGLAKTESTKTNWERFGILPVSSQRIDQFTISSVVILGDDGTKYHCTSGNQECSIFLEKELPHSYVTQFNDCPTIIPPPGNTLHKVEYCDDDFDVSYAVSEGGIVWRSTRIKINPWLASVVERGLFWGILLSSFAFSLSITALYWLKNTSFHKNHG